jgi:AraC-like DNA-binding protein
MINPPRLHRAIDQSPSAISFWKIGSRERWLTEPHLHKQGQLLSLDSGSASMEVSNGAWLLLPGRIVWIPPNESHSMTSNSYISGWSLYLPSELAAILPGSPSIFIRSDLVVNIVARIAHLKQSTADPSVLGRLLAVLADEMTLYPADSSYLPVPRDPRLRRLVEAFSENPASQYELERWARDIGMSKRSLTRRFQAETGMSFGQWIQKFRILVAMEKLASGDDVTSVALSCGYSSMSAFIRIFQLNTGTTPARYRRTSLDEDRVLSKRISLQNDFKAESNNIYGPDAS